MVNGAERLEILNDLSIKKNDVKKQIVSVFPIKNKSDYYIAGTFGIGASLDIIDEFICLDSKNEDEFEQSKQEVIDFLRKEIVKIKNKKFDGPSNVKVADFSKNKAVQDDK